VLSEGHMVAEIGEDRLAHVVHTPKAGGLLRCVHLTRKSLSGAWGHVWQGMEDLAPVLESMKLDLTDGGWIKVIGPPWWPMARRRWRRNGRDFEWHVKTQIRLCAAALERSSFKVSSGILSH
jgi:hypothetical protein